MISFETEQRIRAVAGARIANFEEWVATASEADNFAEVPWLEIVTTASIALMAINEHLEAAESVIERLSRLYRWLIKKETAAEPPQVTLSERVIVLLADQLARRRSGLTLDNLCEQALASREQIAETLERLCQLSIVVKVNSAWMLRARN